MFRNSPVVQNKKSQKTVPLINYISRNKNNTGTSRGSRSPSITSRNSLESRNKNQNNSMNKRNPGTYNAAKGSPAKSNISLSSQTDRKDVIQKELYSHKTSGIYGN